MKYDKRTFKRRGDTKHEKRITNNTVSIEGELSAPFTFSHEVFRKKFYTTILKIPRLSDHHDNFTIMVSERLLDSSINLTGVKLKIRGQFRSYNQHDGTRSHLIPSLFVREVEFLNDEMDIDGTQNKIYLNVYRTTPLGREITDILVAVNRPYGKSDYIPCIAWEKCAFCSQFGNWHTH